MKNRFFKITLLVLSLAFVLGVAFALSAGAEGAVKPEIVGKNISYTDKTAIQIAVDAATVNKNDVELVVTKADGTEITVTDPDEKTINGKNALVFTLEGIPASAICENVTIVVKSGDNQSNAFTYSVAEYFYERLYSDGVINATEGKPLSQKALYERYLSYGAAAQDLFLNYKDGNRVENPVILVDEYNVIAINNGVLDNGNEVMISAESFTTTVTANADLAADKTFTGKWTVTTYGETVTTETVANGATVTANGIKAVTPVYTDATGKYYLDETAKGTRIDYDSDTATLPGGTAKDSNLLSITDGYLLFDNGTQESVEKYFQINMPTVDTSSFSSVCNIVEFDFAYGTFYYNWPMYIRFGGSDKIYFRHDMAAPNAFNKMDDGTGSTSIGQTVDKFFNLRLEIFDVTTDGVTVTVAKLYVNNEYVKDIIASSQVSASRVIIAMTSGQRNNASDAYFKIDNIYLGEVDKAFVAGDPNVAN